MRADYVEVKVLILHGDKELIESIKYVGRKDFSEG